MSRGKRITEDRFRTIKTLLNGGMDKEAVASFTGASFRTVRRINTAKSYDDYVDQTNRWHNKTDAPEEKPAVCVIQPAAPETIKESTQFDRIEALLVLINRDIRLLTREMVKYVKYTKAV